MRKTRNWLGRLHLDSEVTNGSVHLGQIGIQSLDELSEAKSTGDLLLRGSMSSGWKRERLKRGQVKRLTLLREGRVLRVESRRQWGECKSWWLSEVECSRLETKLLWRVKV